MSDFMSILGYLLAPITGVITWIVTRKKRKIEEVDAAYDTWNKIVSSLRTQIDTLVDDNKKLREKLEEMNGEIEQLRVELKGLKEQNKHVKALRGKIEQYEKLLKDNKISF
jgi:peptidoglycan hydrolase CwlO-like protein